jgi:rhodanese-related sulfurtransferase
MLGRDDGGTADDALGVGDAAQGAAELIGVNAEQARAMLESSDVLLIDVRGSSSVRIPGTDAVIDFSRVDDLAAFIGDDLNRRVLLYCNSGNRSSHSGEALVARGYRQIHHLLGGIGAWQHAGYPTESSSP